MSMFGFLKKKGDDSADMPPPVPVPTGAPPKPNNSAAEADADLAMPSFPEPHDEEIALPPITDDHMPGMHDANFPGYIPPPPDDAPAMPEPEPVPQEPVPQPEPEPVQEQPDAPPEPEEEPDAPPEPEPEPAPEPEHKAASLHGMEERSFEHDGPLFIDIVSYTTALDDIKEAGAEFKVLEDELSKIEKIHDQQQHAHESLRRTLEASAKKLQRVDKNILQRRWHA